MIPLVLIAGITAITLGCIPREVTFEQLFADAGKYHGKEITIEGFYFHGFESIILAERLEPSGFAEGHLIPKGDMMWVEGGIPIDIYNRLDTQQMMGPEERLGRVKITGKFETGGQYGHAGGSSSQITPSAVELLP